MSFSPRSAIRDFFSPYPKEFPRAERSYPSFTWREFGHHYLAALLWIIGLTGLVYLMENHGVLKGFETVGLDAFLHLHDRKMSDRIVVVEITNEDYKSRELFDGQSPLNKEKLAELVVAIQDYGPAVIGVDIETDSHDWRNLRPELAARILPPSVLPNAPPHVPVVWAAVPDSPREPLLLAPVLGGRLQDPHFMGVPRFPFDSDGMVRRYESEFCVTDPIAACPARNPTDPENMAGVQERKKCKGEENCLWSLARATLSHACAAKAFDCSHLRQEREQPVIFNFFGDRYRFPIIQSSEFIGPTARKDDKDLREARRGLLNKRIVLIGGNYTAARDMYLTPMEQMAGVELIATAIESDFDGGIRETDKVLEKFADVVAGSLIVFLYYYYRRRLRFAFALSFLGLLLFAGLLSLLLFRTFAYWFNFMPVVIGMTMHQLVELSKSGAELQAEVFALERKLHDATPTQHKKVEIEAKEAPPAVVESAPEPSKTDAPHNLPPKPNP